MSNELLIPDYKKLRNFVNQQAAESKKRFFNEKFSQVKTSSDVWGVMNDIIQFRTKQRNKITKLDVDGETLTDDSDITNQLAHEFIVTSSISNVDDCTDELKQYEKLYAESGNQDVLRSTIVPEEIERSINMIKKGKEGDDHIPKKAYKMFAKQLSLPISVLITNIFALAHVPNCFKRADVIALYKEKGKKDASSSYRAIFLLPFLV